MHDVEKFSKPNRTKVHQLSLIAALNDLQTNMNLP